VPLPEAAEGCDDDTAATVIPDVEKRLWETSWGATTPLERDVLIPADAWACDTPTLEPVAAEPTAALEPAGTCCAAAAAPELVCAVVVVAADTCADTAEAENAAAVIPPPLLFELEVACCAA
jgi:hypothetical protein